MAENSAIEWCDHTFNVWHGCVKVSRGCQHCYAEAQNKRFGDSNWGPSSTRLVMQEPYWRHPIRWNQHAAAAGVRRRVFCGSMCDWAEIVPVKHPSYAMMHNARQRLFDLIEQTPWLDWQLLTKRPENIRGLIPESWLRQLPSNVWIGTSVEDQQSADQRIPILLSIPAQVRFLSCEPLIGPVDLMHVSFQQKGEKVRWLDALSGAMFWGDENGDVDIECNRIDWVICGGESGLQARAMNPVWATQLRDQCQRAAVAFFFKQGGSVLAKDWGCSDTKGGILAEIPEGLRIRQFPATALPVHRSAKDFQSANDLRFAEAHSTVAAGSSNERIFA